MSGCRSCLGCDEFWLADQIVAGHRQGELEAELLDAPKHGPRKSADRLAPAERLLDALSLPLAHRIAGMSCGTGVDRGTSSADVLCDMWRDVECAHVGDECRCVVTQSPACAPPANRAHNESYLWQLIRGLFQQPASMRFDRARPRRPSAARLRNREGSSSCRCTIGRGPHVAAWLRPSEFHRATPSPARNR